MANINEILARAAALRDETALNSISPERAGGIMYDTLLALNDLWLQQGSALLISKIYASVAAMEADTAPISDLTGQPLRPGQIVVIASSDSDNGTIYRYNGAESPSWSAVGQMGNSEPVDSLDSDSSVRPLSARQGKVLSDRINNVDYTLDELEDKVTGLQARTVISSKADATVLAGRIVAAGEWNARNDFTTLVLPVSAGDVVRVVGRSGYSMNYAVYSEFDGTALDKTKATQLGTVINGNVEFDLFVSINADGYIATSSTSNYASQDIYSQSSLDEVLTKMDEDIAEVYNNTLGLPSIHGRVVWTPGQFRPTDGTILTSTVAKYTNLISVHEGDVLRIRIAAANMMNEVQVAAYDNKKTFLPAKSVITSSQEVGYKIFDYQVPVGVAFIRLESENNFADYNTAFPDDMPLISHPGGKEDFVSITEFFEKGFDSANFIHGYDSNSASRNKWFTYSPNNASIIPTRIFPKDGIDYVGIVTGKSINIQQYDKDLIYIGYFSAQNAIRKDDAGWLSNCKYFCLTGAGNSWRDLITEVHYSYENALSVKSPVIQNSADFYDKKVNKCLFLHSSVVNDYDADKMAHGARIVLDGEGNIITPYYHSTTAENESIGVSEGVVVAKSNPCDLGNPVRIDAMVKGETVGDFTQASNVSPYDPNIIKVSDTVFNVLMVLSDGTDTLLGIRQLNPQTMEMGDTITRCKIVYNSVEYPLTVAGLNNMVDAIYGRNPGTTNVGTYPILTTQIKTYGGEKYAFLWSLVGVSQNFSTAWNGALIKTADNGETWEVVSVPTISLGWNSHTNWEVGFDILGDRAYVFFRNTPNDAPICYYDLIGGSWSDAVDLVAITLPYIASPNQTILADPSRPEVYAHNGYIYAMQNVKTSSVGFQARNVFRGMLCVWKLDADLNVVDYKIFQNAFGVHYVSAVLGNGFGYFAFTEDRTAKHQTQVNYNKRHISVMPLEFGTLIW